jgi:hypothetical protein
MSLKCPSCGHDNADESLFCSMCGKKIVQVAPAPSAPPTPPVQPLNDVSALKPAEPVEADKAGLERPSTKPLAVAPFLQCPYCHARVAHDARFCGECGRALVTESLAQQPGVPRLRVLSSNAVIKLPLKKEPVVIGRSDTERGLLADVDLTNYEGRRLGVSRSHCKLHYQDGSWKIEDLGSQNHTEVNGRRMVPGELFALHHNDEIRLGDLRIQFLVD